MWGGSEFSGLYNRTSNLRSWCCWYPRWDCVLTLGLCSLYQLLTGWSQIMCIIHSMPLQKRPQVQGLFGALFGIASVVGPLVGGAFASSVTWRWCFYVNLPIGGAAMIFIVFCLRVPDQDRAKVSWVEKLLQLDFLGTTLLMSGVVCLILALQWGGQTYAVCHMHHYFNQPQLTI